MGANKTVIIIAGPTASGKTDLSIEVAKYFETEIISCDSRQCFRELNIGVARPSEEQLQEVKHHYIASHSIHDKISASFYENYALNICTHLFKEHNQVVMVGGTGLYMKAFCEGMDEMPDIPEPVRAEVVSAYKEHGLEWLQREVEKLDPRFFAEGESRNPHRLMRALEVFKATGRSILSFRTGAKKPRPFDIVKIALDVPRLQLYERIGRRVDNMMGEGLLEEVRRLIPFQHLVPLQTVGYRELFEYFNGVATLPEAVERIKQNTRRYAKRQITWLSKEPGLVWFDQRETVLPYLCLLTDGSKDLK